VPAAAGGLVGRPAGRRPRRHPAGRAHVGVEVCDWGGVVTAAAFRGLGLVPSEPPAAAGSTAAGCQGRQRHLRAQLVASAWSYQHRPLLAVRSRPPVRPGPRWSPAGGRPGSVCGAASAAWPRPRTPTAWSLPRSLTAWSLPRSLTAWSLPRSLGSWPGSCGRDDRLTASRSPASRAARPPPAGGPPTAVSPARSSLPRPPRPITLPKPCHPPSQTIAITSHSISAALSALRLMNRPGFGLPEAWVLESGGAAGILPLVVGGLELCWRDVADGL
jgi:hypothetical protein